MRYGILIAILLSASPAAAWAQQAGARGETRAWAESRAATAGEALGHAEAQGQAEARIQAAIQKAAAAGIPAELLERKVAEGKAKGVSEARIAGAVESRLEALVRAQAALSEAAPRPTGDELLAAAAALEAGASASAVARIGREAPPERRPAALSVLGGLVAEGYASEQALARVSAALQEGAGSLRALEATLRAGQGGGASVVVQPGAGAGASVGVGASTAAGVRAGPGIGLGAAAAGGATAGGGRAGGS